MLYSCSDYCSPMIKYVESNDWERIELNSNGLVQAHFAADEGNPVGDDELLV